MVEEGEDEAVPGVRPTADLIGEHNPGVPDLLAQLLELLQVEGEGAVGHCLTAVDADPEVDDAHLIGPTHVDLGVDDGERERGRGSARLLAHAIDKSG